jgi:hypothetical protein
MQFGPMLPGVAAAIIIAASVGLMFAVVIQDRIEKYPQLGTDIIPKSEKQRREEAEPKRYVRKIINACVLSSRQSPRPQHLTQTRLPG